MPPRGPGWILALALLACLPVRVLSAENPAWLEEARGIAPGPFPMIAPFEADFRFGWSGIEAARATVRFSIQGGTATVRASGGTTGFARTLWRLDANHTARFLPADLRPLDFFQEERYARKILTTQAVFRPDGLWRLRERRPQGGPARWKPIRVEPVFDMATALFLVRSQRLADGQRIPVVAFPGDSPFLVEVTVVRREPLTLRGKTLPAIRLDLKIRRIVSDKDAPPRLVSHTKFRTGTAWISDDARRFPLRAEVDLFIGSIFAEVTRLP